ncbi:MAG TPA: hypothetical protein VI758_02070 [Bacteroidota bacterium]
MRLLPASILFIVVPALLTAQLFEKPGWVRLHQQGLLLSDSVECYFGIGSSPNSQEEADAGARHDFAMNVEMKVENVIVHNVQELDNSVKEEYSANVRISSEVVLRGIGISARYEDVEHRKFYSLIRIQKSTFDTLLATEMQRDLERKKTGNRAEEEMRAEELRSRQVQLDLKKKEEATRVEELDLERKEFAEFLGFQAPDQVIDLRNGEVARNSYTIGLKAPLSAVALQSAYFLVAFWHFELSAHAYFEPGRLLKSSILHREQVAFKIQMLQGAGEMNKTSLAIGIVGYSNVSSLRALDTVQGQVSLFAAGDIALPKAFYTYASAYLDERKFSFGLSNIPFPELFKDAVSLLVQLDYVWDNNWRNRFQDPLLIQCGIRFRTSDEFTTSLTYENHEFTVFSIEVGF